MVKTKQQKKAKGPGGRTPGRPALTGNDGAPSKSLAVSSSLQTGIPRRIIFTVLSGVMPRGMARELSGYRGKTNKFPDFVDTRTVAEIRERLQSIPGATLADQVGFYVGVREDKDVATSDKIAAAKQIDKDLGYESPAKVEISNRREIGLAVGVFHQFLGKSKLSPRELVEIAEAEEGVVEEKELLTA